MKYCYIASEFPHKLMIIPKKLEENPVVFSTVEVRFSSNIDKPGLLALVYESLSKSLVFLGDVSINPQQIAQGLIDINPEYFPAYAFKNSEYSFAIGPRSIIFETVGSYKPWDQFFTFIKSEITKIFDVGLINEMERIGVRYGNMIERRNVSDVMRVIPAFNNNKNNEAIFDGEEIINRYECEIRRGEIEIKVRLGNNVLATKDSNNYAGIYLDIDAGYNHKFKKDINFTFATIEHLHNEVKTMFFGLLKPDLISSLNPTY